MNFPEKMTIADLFSEKMFFALKDNLWILGLGGVFYQLTFLIFYDSLVLFSWTQIPVDSVFFLLSLLVTYAMAWPWLHDDFGGTDNKNLFLKKEIFYFALFYILLLLILIFGFGLNFHWLLWGLFVQLNFSFIIYIFVLIKRKFKKEFSEKTKSIILGILVFLNCVMFGGNMYSNYEYFDPKTEKRIEILYMNDKYILTEEKVAKNDSGLVLKKVEINLD